MDASQYRIDCRLRLVLGVLASRNNPKVCNLDAEPESLSPDANGCHDAILENVDDVRVDRAWSLRQAETILEVQRAGFNKRSGHCFLLPVRVSCSTRSYPWTAPCRRSPPCSTDRYPSPSRTSCTSLFAGAGVPCAARFPSP